MEPEGTLSRTPRNIGVAPMRTSRPLTESTGRSLSDGEGRGAGGAPVPARRSRPSTYSRTPWSPRACLVGASQMIAPW